MNGSNVMIYILHVLTVNSNNLHFYYI